MVHSASMATVVFVKTNCNNASRVCICTELSWCVGVRFHNTCSRNPTILCIASPLLLVAANHNKSTHGSLGCICSLYPTSAADRGGGQQGQFALGPQYKGPPNSAWLIEIRCGRQSHSSLAYLRGSFRCIFYWSQPTCLLRVLCLKLGACLPMHNEVILSNYICDHCFKLSFHLTIFCSHVVSWHSEDRFCTSKKGGIGGGRLSLA